ncbi:major head protein [Thermus phage phiFa]|nr:major head protein [Thermus phage phiFa]
MAIFELNAGSDLRFPTRKEVEKIIQDLDTEYFGWADTSQYKLASRFFPINAITATELELYVVKNPHKYGMTYFHAPGTEPRTWSKEEAYEVYKASFKGAHFKEGAYWGEVELTNLASVAPGLRTVRIQEQVAEALLDMAERRKRRIEWMVAQILTTGKLVVTKSLPDNPEGIEFTVDYKLHDPEIVLANKFDEKDANGESIVDPVKFFLDLRYAALEDRTVGPGKYLPTELIVTSNFVKVLRENTKFWAAWYGFNNRDTTKEATPIYFYPDEYILDAFSRMTGLKVTVYDQGYLDKDGVFHKFIPDDKAVLIYSGPGKFGEFTMTAHVHTQGDRLVLGTGPYVLVDDGRKKPNPYYAIFHGFHGLPRLLDYDPKTLENHRIKFFSYATV